MFEKELAICNACGSQFDAEAASPPSNCKICDVSILNKDQTNDPLFDHTNMLNPRILANLYRHQGSHGLH